MSNNIQKTIEAYNKTALEYEAKVAGFHHLEEGEIFVKGLYGGINILDLGCGDGRDAKVFYDRKLRVTGIDLSSEMIKIAKQKNPYVTFLQQDIRNLNLEKNSFNGVWAVASLLHIPKENIEETLNGIYDVLKENGLFYCCVKKGIGEELIEDKRYEGVSKFYSYYEEGELEKLIELTGMQVLGSKLYSWNNDYIEHPEIRIFAQK